MYGLDWEKLCDCYGVLIEDVCICWDVLVIQLNLVVELSVGYIYIFGGDNEWVCFSNIGYLGIDWEFKDGIYCIVCIVCFVVWDMEVCLLLDCFGVDIKVGDEILLVNGCKLLVDQVFYVVFEGLVGEMVSLKVCCGGEIIVYVISCLNIGQEICLCYLEWIEQNC